MIGEFNGDAGRAVGSSVTNWADADDGDFRLQEGYRRQSDQRDRLLSRGARLIGVKIGANDRPSQMRLRIGGPILGFLTDASVLPAGLPIPIGDAVLAGVEPELAFTLASALPPDPTREEVAGAVSRVSIAAEIIDVSHRYDDVAELLASNIFHRATAHPSTPSAARAEDIQASRLVVEKNGTVTWALHAGCALGDALEAVRFAARTASRQGVTLGPGHIVLSGLLTALPVWVRSGDHVTLDAGALGRLELHFAAGG